MDDRTAREITACMVAVAYCLAATWWLPATWWRVALTLGVAAWARHYAHS